MHPDQHPIDDDLVRRLIAEQFPQWAGRPVARFPSGGTVNALYRLGESLAVRLPLVAGGIADVALPAEAREVFRRALNVDDATWTRGRGRALSRALTALPYYRDTNPAMAHNARHVLRTVLQGQ